MSSHAEHVRKENKRESRLRYNVIAFLLFLVGITLAAVIPSIIAAAQR
ncbi:MAG: hypothetical protein RIT04_320 [Candidatus Parcubacteria bacterium]|jgi:heme/copper-type cytochrome/quinol oxidase subunit 4